MCNLFVLLRSAGFRLNRHGIGRDNSRCQAVGNFLAGMAELLLFAQQRNKFGGRGRRHTRARHGYRREPPNPRFDCVGVPFGRHVQRGRRRGLFGLARLITCSQTKVAPTMTAAPTRTVRTAFGNIPERFMCEYLSDAPDKRHGFQSAGGPQRNWQRKSRRAFAVMTIGYPLGRKQLIPGSTRLASPPQVDVRFANAARCRGRET